MYPELGGTRNHSYLSFITPIHTSSKPRLSGALFLITYEVKLMPDQRHPDERLPEDAPRGFIPPREAR